MRGKSARVGSGFVAESPTSPFPPFQLPIKRRFLVGDKTATFFGVVQVQYGLH
jgi:hypothetical protein